MPKQTRDNLDTIQCPSCGHAVPITEALQHRLTEQLNHEIELKESDLKRREAEIAKREESVDDRVKKEVDKAVSGREAEIERREAIIASERKSINKKVQEELDKERRQIEVEAKKRAEAALSLEIRDTKARLKETEEKLQNAEKSELALRKRERELEEKERNAELEVARQLSAQRAEIEESVTKKFAEDYRFKDLEREKVIKDLQKALEDANRKAQQGSQQLQGEVQELDLEASFAEHFPLDEIKSVPKGVPGADFLQVVRTASGTACGTILWESKRTKHWNEAWLSKLKDDQRDAKADIAGIISAVLPRDLPPSGYRDRVWITNYSSLLMLASALRAGLLHLASLKLAEANRDKIGDMLVQYVTGPQFRHKMEAMIDTFRDMREGIEKEKRSSFARWAKEEKQIDKLVVITAGAYGDLRGLVGSSMQSIPALEADETVDSDDVEEAVPALSLTANPPKPEIQPEEFPF